MTTLDAYILGRAKMRRLAESGDMWRFREQEIKGKAFARVEADDIDPAEIELPLALFGRLAVDVGGHLCLGTYSDGRVHIDVLLVGPLEAMATTQNGAVP